MERMTKVEQALLINLVDRNKNIIQNKKTDAGTNAAKLRSWMNIENEFNTSEHVNMRTWKQLRKAWENMKGKRRRMQTLEMQERVKSDGGIFVTTSGDSFPELEIVVSSLRHSETNVEGVQPAEATSAEADCKLMEEVDVRLDQPQPTHVDTSAEEVKTFTEAAAASRSSSRTSSEYTPRSQAIERELEARLESLRSNNDRDEDIHYIRKRAAELKVQIKKEELRLKQAELANVLAAGRHQQWLFRMERKIKEEEYRHKKEKWEKEKSSSDSHY